MRTKLQLFPHEEHVFEHVFEHFQSSYGLWSEVFKSWFSEYSEWKVFLSPHEAFRGEVRTGKGTKKRGQNFCGISESKIKGEPEGFSGRGNEEKVLHPEGWRGSARWVVHTRREGEDPHGKYLRCSVRGGFHQGPRTEPEWDKEKLQLRSCESSTSEEKMAKKNLGIILLGVTLLLLAETWAQNPRKRLSPPKPPKAQCCDEVRSLKVQVANLTSLLEELSRKQETDLMNVVRQIMELDKQNRQQETRVTEAESKYSEINNRVEIMQLHTLQSATKSSSGKQSGSIWYTRSYDILFD